MEWINGPEILAGIAIMVVALYLVWHFALCRKTCPVCKKRTNKLTIDGFCKKCDDQMAEDLYQWERGCESREYWEHIMRGEPTAEEISRWRARWNSI